MQNYKTRIAQAKSSFELSCIWEEVLAMLIVD